MVHSDFCQRKIDLEFLEEKFVSEVCLNVKLETRCRDWISLAPTVRLMALRRPMKRHRRGIHYDRSKLKQPWSRKRETWWKLKMWWSTEDRDSDPDIEVEVEIYGNYERVRSFLNSMDALPRILDYDYKYNDITWNSSSLKDTSSLFVQIQSY